MAHLWSMSIRLECGPRLADEPRIGVGIVGRFSVVIACAFVAHRGIDDDEVWGRPGGRDLSGGRQAQQQAASAREQFFGNQHGKRGADRATDDADGSSPKRERVEFGVIAGPPFERPRAAIPA